MQIPFVFSEFGWCHAGSLQKLTVKSSYSYIVFLIYGGAYIK